MISVLYVDDEQTLLDLTKLFLEYRGEFSVDTKKSVEEGLAVLKTRKYDAVISDFQMPGIDGLEFLRIVRSSFGDLPFILFTGKGKEEVAIQAIDDGVDFYIRKGEDARLQFSRLENRIRLGISRRTSHVITADFGFQVADLVNFFPDAVFAIDKDGTLIAWNKAMEELTGVTSTEILGKGNYAYSQILYGEPQPSLSDLFFQRDAGVEKYYPLLNEGEGGVLVAKTRLNIPRLSSQTLSCRAMPLRDRSGTVIGAIESISPLPDRDHTTERPGKQTIAVSGEDPAAPAGLYDQWQKMDDIIASLPGVVFQYCVRSSGENDVYFANRSSSEAILGFDHADGDFFPWFTRHVHPEDRDRFTATIDNIQNDTLWNFEGRFLKPSGETIWIWGTGNQSVRGNERIYAGIFLDCSARKKSEQKILESEEKFRVLAEHSHEPAIVVDFYGSILFANSAAARVLETPDGTTLTGKTILDFISPESRDAAVQEFTQTPVGTDDFREHYTFISVRGTQIPVEITGSVVVYEGKKANFLSLKDVTECKTLEDALKKNDEKFHLLFEHIDEPVALCEIVATDDNTPSDYRILEANEAFEQTFGASRPAIIGKTSREAYNIPEPSHIDVFSRVAATGKREIFEEYFPNLQKHFRISVSSPGPNRFTTVFYDITEHKKAKTALLQANHQLNLMASITRHDVLNNVSAVLGYLTILRMKFQNPALAYYFTKLEDITRAIQHLISDTQMYQNFGISEPKWQEIGALIRCLQVPERIALTANLSGVELYADPLLEKVFFNLLDNSIRHGQNVTEIRISSRQPDDRLILTWEDNGIGIPDEEKSRIFEKAFGKNTGLGLFLCREILSITNISIQETGEPGRGARFEIMVPPGGYRLTNNGNYPEESSIPVGKS